MQYKVIFLVILLVLQWTSSIGSLLSATCLYEEKRNAPPIIVNSWLLWLSLIKNIKWLYPNQIINTSLARYLFGSVSQYVPYGTDVLVKIKVRLKGDHFNFLVAMITAALVSSHQFLDFSTFSCRDLVWNFRCLSMPVGRPSDTFLSFLPRVLRYVTLG